MTGISATISVDTPTLIIGATSTVEIHFNEAATGFDASDLILPGGAISNLTSGDGGINWTATYTPQAGVQSATNVIGLNLSSVMDGGGVAGANLEVDSNNFIVDGVAPFIDSVTIQNINLHPGQTSPVTFHFSEFVNGFNLNQVIVGDGTLSNLTTANNITWTATFTPRDGVTDQGLTITAHPIVTDFAGNSGGGSATSNGFDLDTTHPQGQISLVHNIVLDPTHTGDVLVNFNEPVTGLTAGALIGAGTFSNVHAIDPSDYTATFTPNAGIQSASQTFSVDMTQVTAVSDGNAGVGTITSAPFSVDTLGPTSTITIGSGAPIVGTAPVTIHFSEAVSGFSNSLANAADGTLSTFTTTDNQTFTGTFTANAGVQEGFEQLTVDNTGVTDGHGNAGAGTGIGIYDVDNVAPTLQSATVTDTAPHAGEADIVNVVFSEPVTGFTLADVTAQDAAVSNLVNDGGGQYHFTLTPNEGVVAGGDTATVTTAGVSDLAGNAATGSLQSNAYNLDTLRPTASLHMAGALIGGGQTSPFTINFSEAVSGFDNSDLTVTGGTLSTVTTADNIHFTATFTPAANTFQLNDTITLNAAGVTSVATGNAGLGSIASNSFNVETQPPTISSIQTPAAVGITQGSFNVVFSEPVASFPLSALGGNAQGMFLTPGTSGAHTVWNIRFNPDANANQTGAFFSVDMSQVVDFGGNHGSGTTDSNPFNIDDVRPTAISLNVPVGTFHAGDTAQFTLTLSEPVQSVTTNMFSFPFGGGAVSNLATADNGMTWTGTFTPPVDLRANEAFLFNASDIVDLAGNPGNTGPIQSNQYNVLTLEPTATISLSDDHVGTNRQLTVTVNVNDLHVIPTFTLTAPDADITGLHQTGSTTYQATLTPHPGVVDPADVVTLSHLDNTFNVNPATFTSQPFALVTTSPGGSVNLNTTPLHAGQTAAVDFHFSEAVQTLPLAAITAQHGAVSNLMSTNGGVDWTAVFTPAANDPSDMGSVSLDLGQVSDFGGNSGVGVVSSATVPIDTLAPTATITLDHPTLTVGQTALVTISFSESVTGFTNGDLTVADGTLSAVASADGGHTWTSTFTPAAATFHDGDHITLNNPGIMDIDGNPGVGTTISTAYNVETGQAPPPPPPPPAPPPPPPPPVGGPETLTATAGDNTLTGGTSGDMVIGSSGSDSMSGQGGADTLSGGDGNDFLQGNTGTDSLNGGNGDDKVYGGQGDDLVQGGPGNDFVSGDKGDDTLRGGQGDDSVSGGDGNDFLSGDLGDDTLTGGAGADVFHSFSGAGKDVVTDFNLAQGDRVELDPGTTFTTAQVGADTVITLSGPGGPAEVILQGVQLSSLHGDWIFVG